MINLEPQMQINSYTIIEKVNSNSKNPVFKVSKIINNEKKFFILKAIPYETEEEQGVYINENNILNLFNNNSEIIKYVESFILNNKITKGKQTMLIVMNFYEHKDLENYKNTTDQISSENIKSIAYQSLKILNTIHKENVIHHDVKPSNFLIKSLSPLMINITDFEFAVKLSKDELTKQIYGTSFYMAPELLNYEPHGTAVDIWALGVMLYQITAKKLPFNLKENLTQAFIIRMKIEKNILEFDDNFKNPLFKDLLSKMLKKNPSERITADEALRHPYFQNFQIKKNGTFSEKEKTDNKSQLN